MRRKWLARPGEELSDKEALDRMADANHRRRARELLEQLPVGIKRMRSQGTLRRTLYMLVVCGNPYDVDRSWVRREAAELSAATKEESAAERSSEDRL